MKIRALLFLLFLALGAAAEPWPQLPVTVNSENYLSISPDGSYVALDTGRDVQVWSGKKLAVVRRLRDLERPLSITFSPDNRHLVVSDYPVKFTYYDCADGLKKVWDYQGPWDGRGDVLLPGSYSMLFSPDGKYLLAVGGAHGAQPGDSTVRLFDTSTGRVVFSQAGWGGRYAGSLSNFCFSPDSKMLLRSANDKLQAYALPTGKKLREKRLGGEMLSMWPSEKGAMVRHYIEGGTKLVEQLYSFSDLSLLGTRGEYSDFEQQPDGPLHWRLDGDRLQVAKGEDTVYTGNEKEKLAYWVPGGGFVVSGQSTGYGLYDVEGRKLDELGSYSQFNRGLAWLGVGYGGPSPVIDLLTGKKLADFSFVADLALSENGKVLAVACTKGVYLMDVDASRKAGTAVGCKPPAQK